MFPRITYEEVENITRPPDKHNVLPVYKKSLHALLLDIILSVVVCFDIQNI
jgi:hypothetical protein